MITPIKYEQKNRSYYRRKRVSLIKGIIDTCITMLQLSVNKIERFDLTTLTNIKNDLENLMMKADRS